MTPALRHEGVTQVIMGSALFPLFEVMYSIDDNEDGPVSGMPSSELAWRTVFVVPSIISLVTAYVIVYHCDDSPKGDYRERVRQQEISVVSPSTSLCVACENWNVWILLFQYSCCFGVSIFCLIAVSDILRCLPSHPHVPFHNEG
jgi:NNP family nitrate/nitrite transporter-like MFS transporter